MATKMAKWQQMNNPQKRPKHKQRKEMNRTYEQIKNEYDGMVPGDLEAQNGPKKGSKVVGYRHWFKVACRRRIIFNSLEVIERKTRHTCGLV
jgi:hypothetical protein